MPSVAHIDVSKIIREIGGIVKPVDPKDPPTMTLEKYLCDRVLDPINDQVYVYEKEYNSNYGGAKNKIKNFFSSSKRKSLAEFKTGVENYVRDLTKLRKMVNVYNMPENKGYDKARNDFVKKLDNNLKSLNNLLKIKDSSKSKSETDYKFSSISSNELDINEKNIRDINDIVAKLKKKLEGIKAKLTDVDAKNKAFNRSYKLDYLATTAFEARKKQLEEYIKSVEKIVKTGFKDEFSSGKAWEGVKKAESDVEEFTKELESELTTYEEQLNKLNAFVAPFSEYYVFDNNMLNKSGTDSGHYEDIKNGIVKGQYKKDSGHEISCFANADGDTQLPTVLEVIKDHKKLTRQFDHPKGDRSGILGDSKGPFYMIVDKDGNAIVGGKTVGKGWRKINHNTTDDAKARTEVIGYIEDSIPLGRWADEVRKA